MYVSNELCMCLFISACACTPALLFVTGSPTASPTHISGSPRQDRTQRATPCFNAPLCDVCAHTNATVSVNANADVNVNVNVDVDVDVDVDVNVNVDVNMWM